MQAFLSFLQGFGKTLSAAVGLVVWAVLWYASMNHKVEANTQRIARVEAVGIETQSELKDLTALVNQNQVEMLKILMRVDRKTSWLKNDAGGDSK